jgi:endogenous inhibitor of DNA gyrase (YacG/DUF329 family)
MVCPICKKPVEQPREDETSFYPFCSERCKLIDRGRWLGGKYRIPVHDPETAAADDRRDDSGGKRFADQ